MILYVNIYAFVNGQRPEGNCLNASTPCLQLVLAEVVCSKKKKNCIHVIFKAVGFKSNGSYLKLDILFFIFKIKINVNCHILISRLKSMKG